MAMAEKFNTGQEGLLADPQRAWSYASQRGHLWVNSGRLPARFRGEIHSAAEGPPFEGRAPQNSARARQPRPVTSGDDGTDTVASSTRPADVG